MVTGITRLVVPALTGAGVLVFLSSATAATGERAGLVGLPATPVVKATPGTSTWRRGTVIRRDDGRIAFLPGPPDRHGPARSPPSSALHCARPTRLWLW